MTAYPPFSLQGKVIIQFGGTGLLGRALVAELASTGCTLIVASRNRAALQSLADKEHAAGRTVLIEETDIGSEDSLKALRDRVLARHQRVDGIVFNAVSRPMRAMNVEIHGSVATHFSIIDRIGRGLGAAVNIATPIIAASRGI